MRVGRSALGTMLLAAGLAAGQSATTDGFVRVPSAEVRGGRSAIFPVTAMLRQGQAVRVVREESGWLAIAPPESSSSWIMERVLDFDQPPSSGRRTIAYVLGDDAPVLLGTPDNPVPLPNVVANLKRGTLVVLTGEKATSAAMGDTAVWWRIQPAPGEVRWIAKGAVTPVATAPSSPTTAAKPTNANRPTAELWLRAEQAERAGNVPQAIACYRQLASEQSRPAGDHDLALRSVNRAEFLARLQPATTTSARPAAPSPTTTWPAGVLMTSGAGTLRRAAFQIDGQTAYVLENARGYPVVYAIAQPGLTLESYVNRSVELFGPMVNRPEMTFRGYMAVSRLHLLR